MTFSLSGLAVMVLPPALIWATAQDLLYRRVGNWLVLALALLWLSGLALEALRDGDGRAALLVQAAWALPGALAVLLVGFVLFRLGQVGAGDVKLMAVLCLWVGAPQQPAFLVLTSLIGGLLVLASPILAIFETFAAHFWRFAMGLVPGLKSLPPPHALAGKPIVGIPYALAISAGAALALSVPANP